MKVILRKALPDDYEQIAFVHYKAWLETYTGLLPESFLKNRTLESSINIFKNNLCSNTVVAIVEGKIIGFCGESKKFFSTSDRKQYFSTAEIF